MSYTLLCQEYELNTCLTEADGIKARRKETDISFLHHRTCLISLFKREKEHEH
jgi:hypothetical protein